MKRFTILLVLLAILSPAAVAQEERKSTKIPAEARMQRPTSVDHPMIEAERAFSKMSVEKGIQEAFLTFLADDAVIFRPEPVSGRQWYADHGGSQGTLSWEPTYVEIAGSGELAFSTGPYEYRGASGGPPTHGHFVSIWERKVVGWRVVLDHGISHAKPSAPAALEVHPISDVKKRDWEDAISALFDVDHGFASLATTEAMSAAYKEHGAPDLRLYREGYLPVEGRDAAIAKLPQLPVLTGGDLEGAGVSRARDLAFSYGTGTLTDVGTGTRGPATYIRVWRKADDKDEWKMILELATPKPEEKKKEEKKEEKKAG